jgi:hypothetical protein
MLLCELHAHTTWSDGVARLEDVVDIYGAAGFDVLCVTDHVVRSDDPWRDLAGGRVGITEENVGEYVAALELEAERAWSRYRLLVVPGLELTANHLDPDQAAHAVAVGLREYVGVDDGIAEALRAARARGAALIAAHPHSDESEGTPDRLTRRFWREWDSLGSLVDRAEVVNRSEPYGWVARAGLPAVASGDFHRPEHLSSWKTLLACEQREQAVVDYLRSARPTFVGHVDAAARAAA